MTKTYEAAAHTAMERRPSSSCFSFGHHAIEKSMFWYRMLSFVLSLNSVLTCTRILHKLNAVLISLQSHRYFFDDIFQGARVRKIKMRNRGNMR
ncbi:unnamed protein product [Sphagnum troendelagicum]|uniref:Uncharacterized protein n=1 Tax=Sphagnum troendelagicum TaxID=128251 RepID=A0ABP0THF4_9BRYO